MWIDEMMMISPLPFRTSTTREESIIELYSTDDLFGIKRALESHFPSSSTKEIPTEIDEISRVGGLVGWWVRIYHSNIPIRRGE